VVTAKGKLKYTAKKGRKKHGPGIPYSVRLSARFLPGGKLRRVIEQSIRKPLSNILIHGAVLIAKISYRRMFKKKGKNPRQWEEKAWP
jgi:hypothetical protein